MKVLISHLAAVLCGVLVAVFVPTREEESRTSTAEKKVGVRAQAQPGRGHDGARTETRLAARECRGAWEALATTSLTKIERDTLKRQLMQEWMSLDPVGLLAYFDEHPNWPYQTMGIFRNLDDTDLPKLKPKLFLEFVRRQGWDKALFGLGGESDVFMALLSELPEKERGTAFSKWVERERNTVDHLGIAMKYFRDDRFEEFATEYEKISAEKVRDEIAYEIEESIELLRLDDAVLNRLLQLPNELADDVLTSRFSDLGSAGMAFRAAREDRRRIARTIAEAGLLDTAAYAVTAMDYENFEPAFDQRTAHRENIEWAMALPVGENYDQLRREIFSDMTYSNPRFAMTAVAELPPGPMRDVAVEAVVRRAQNTSNGLDPEDKEARLEDLVSTISNDETRDEMERLLNPPDPFGDEGDE